MAKYTTVKEMSEQVNKLYDLLREAKELAFNIAQENQHNRFALINRTEEALDEERPLTIPQRIDEAKRQHNAFGKVHDSIVNLEEFIGMIY